MLMASFANIQARTEKITHWEGYVGEFRRDHHFALAFGSSSSTWQIKPWDHAQAFTPETKGYFSKFQYSYHIPLVGAFGYFLGSSVGVLADFSDNDSRFSSSTAYQLPGILAGLCMNFSPVWRASAGTDIYLERIHGIAWQDEFTVSKLSINMLAFADMLGQLDYFWDIDWAFRLEAHSRHVHYTPPQRNKENKVVAAKVSRADQWIGLGIVYHRL